MISFDLIYIANQNMFSCFYRLYNKKVSLIMLIDFDFVTYILFHCEPVEE